jgi:hypothetical protein
VTYLEVELPKKEILIAYVSNFLIPKIPENPKNVIKSSPKGKFDGLCKQVM